MTYKFEEGKDLIIKAVADRIRRNMKGKQGVDCAEFIRQFYGTVSIDDLRAWDVDDQYGAAINFWDFIRVRAPEETKIHIYNPDFEKHGWQTTHTVVEVITDDMPFIVDSLRMVINKLGIVSHLIIHLGGLRFVRDNSNQIIDILLNKDNNESIGEASKDLNSLPKNNILIEAAVFIEIDRQTDASILMNLYQNLTRVLSDTRVVVKDWLKMRAKVCEAIDELDKVSSVLDPGEVAETKAFLHWIEDHHFTFLGIRDYKLIRKKDEVILEPLPETGLGLLRQDISKGSARSISALTAEARELTLSSRILVMSKTNTESTVHRRAYTDYIGIKQFNKKGEVVSERRIIGLYTSVAYNTNPKYIPFLRHKVDLVMKNSNLNPRGHAGKILLNILETLPRDDLIQASEDELLEIGMGIFYMQERRRIRLFARTDVYRRFVSCLIFVPKERFNTELRLEMEKILAATFHSREITFSTLFSESVLARIHFIVRTNPDDQTQWNFKELERKLIAVGRNWTDELQFFLFEAFGEEYGNQLFARCKTAFPIAYSSNYSPRTAVNDLKHTEALTPENPLGMNFYKLLSESNACYRLKIYQHNDTIPLSDVLPILERLGMRAISERPYLLQFEDGKQTWINDFAMVYTGDNKFDIDDIKTLFQNAFASVWFGEAENDGFNQLVLAATLDWRQVSVLRAYAKYFKQIGVTFSQEYIEAALYNNPTIAKKLVRLFATRFDIKANENRDDFCKDLIKEIFKDLDEVSNLDEDKIIRQYVSVIMATIRTNYYQPSEKHKSYISFKLNSKDIPGIPKPLPMYEIFVYSTKFEAVHLRGGKVARGGIRWSERREDFRTEILGLMKAQQVKNTVIVPTGAKGGFVPKQIPINATREIIIEEGINCYKQFIRGLLDITDNYQKGQIVKPKNVICYDGDDPYLVVAADKGTATFSDLANEISLEYKFWLGDAFASGGSIGYDHKKMGITAKGAWESVKRHFFEMNQDIYETDFTVVGIGDMSGDVFGNGMLLSRHIKLLGAFNHIHIFVDPNPDPLKSFEERQRLFNLPRSNWTDYNPKLISKGGGVFNRSAKIINVTKEMQQAFGIAENLVEPNDLIRAMLCAKVDLLWSAGIGTFIKASTETNLEVGDRTNDMIRVNGKNLRCKVVGEGGNLGLTQLGRIEYASNGGRLYTDFIDNVGGVNCSDKEVNIKILLDAIVVAGDITFKQRNELLAEMTEDVTALVLKDSFAQPRSLSLSAAQAVSAIGLHGRFISELERLGKLDRELEFLPKEEAIQECRLAEKGLTTPTLSILLSYSKMTLKEQILASKVPTDPYLTELLVSCFPRQLQQRFNKEIQKHPLKKEIIATKLSNTIINEMGFTFVYRLVDETGAQVLEIVLAYMISRMVLDFEKILQGIVSLGTSIPASTQNQVMLLYLRLLRRMTRWFLRKLHLRLSISKGIEKYAADFLEFKKAIPSSLGNENIAQYESDIAKYKGLNIPKDLAHELAIANFMFSALDVIDISQKLIIPVAKVAEVYYSIGSLLELGWIRSLIISQPTSSHWEVLSREALRDDLDWQQRKLTAAIIKISKDKKNFKQGLDHWSKAQVSLIDRWRNMLANLRSSPSITYTFFFAAIRELLDLTQTTLQMISNETEKEVGGGKRTITNSSSS